MPTSATRTSASRQSGVGAVIGLWPVVEDRYAAAGYTAAFCIIFVLQLAALVWAARGAGRADGAAPAR